MCVILYATKTIKMSSLSSKGVSDCDLCVETKCCSNLPKKDSEDELSEGKRHVNNNITDAKGVNFVLIFPEQYEKFQAKPQSLVSSDQTNRVYVSSFNSYRTNLLSIDQSISSFDLDTDVLMIDGVNEAGVEIRSDTPMSVYGFIHDDWHSNSEGYLAIPIRFASTKYMVATVRPSRFRGFSFISKSTIAIAALHSNTTVEINLKMETGPIKFNRTRYQNGDTLNICLDKHNTFQLSHTSDLSGTIVSATLPILVVTGNPCNYIKSRHGCNPFFEMILPTNQLDYFYIIPKIATRDSSTVRIFTLTATVVKIKAGAVETQRPINERDFHDYIHNDISYVWASTNIMVIIFPHELADNQANAFMMTIHGVHQYLDEYFFAVPEGFISYLSIVCSGKDTNGFTLDGIALRPEQISITTVDYGLLNFSTFTIRINRGAHHMTHVNKTQFGLWVYGNAYYNAYGYPAGIAFKTYDKT